MIAIVMIAAAGCSDETANRANPPIRVVSPPSSPKEKSGTADTAPAAGKSLQTGPFEKSFDGISFSVPAGWNEVPLSAQQQGFIDAKFQIPTKDGNATLTCSSNAGGIKSNVNRWIGQFRQQDEAKKPIVEEMEVSGKTATWVDVRGEFNGGMPGMMASNSGGGSIERMLGAAIPLGERDFYLKLTGTNAAVSDVRDAFREFVRGARVSNSK